MLLMKMVLFNSNFYWSKILHADSAKENNDIIDLPKDEVSNDVESFNDDDGMYYMTAYAV